MWNEIEKMDLDRVVKDYEKALRIVLTKIEILNESYKEKDMSNPIEHIKGRIKSSKSIYEKLKRKNIEITADSVIEHIDDIAGVRIICSFANDIYKIADIIKNQTDITFVKETDYIKEPKPNGYRSYHLIVKVPVYEVYEVKMVKVEVQIRTGAMDFWASLEHKAKYKYNGEVPQNLLKELKVCSEKSNELDERMYLIHDIISLIK